VICLKKRAPYTSSVLSKIVRDTACMLRSDSGVGWVATSSTISVGRVSILQDLGRKGGNGAVVVGMVSGGVERLAKHEHTGLSKG